MKVFGGELFYKGGQFRVAVAAKSINAVATLLGMTHYYVSTYWAETGNERECDLALASPGRVIVDTNQYDRIAREIPHEEVQGWFDKKYTGKPLPSPTSGKEK